MLGEENRKIRKWGPLMNSVVPYMYMEVPGHFRPALSGKDGHGLLFDTHGWMRGVGGWVGGWVDE
jgi:hypothetical protein